MHSTYRTLLCFSLSKAIAKLFYLARQWIRIQYIQKEKQKKKKWLVKSHGEKMTRKQLQENTSI